MKFTVTNLRNYVIAHFARVFWVTLILAIIPAGIMLGHKQYLTTKAAPKGIISLELAWDTATVHDIIINSWQDTVRNTNLYNNCDCGKDQYDYRVQPGKKDIYLRALAQKDVWTDFIFIIFYSFFGWIILVKLRDEIGRSGNKTPAWVLPAWIAVAAGVFDCIENTGMLIFLYNHTNYKSIAAVSYIYTGFSALKDGLIILFNVYVIITCGKLGLLAKLSGYLSSKMQQLWRYRVIVFGLLAFALPLWFANQGQDLLININNSNWGVAIFLGVITIAAFLNWYLAKLFFQDKYIPPFVPWREPQVMEKDETITNDAQFKAIRDEKLRHEKKASRFLGVITFLFPAFGILNALDAFKIDYGADFVPPSTWVIISVGLAYIIVQNELFNRWFGNIKNKGLFLLITIAILAGVLPGIFLVAANLQATNGSHSPASLGFIALDLVLLATVFLLFVCLRNNVRSGFIVFTKKIGTPILLAALAACLFFIVTNVWPMVFVGHNATYITLPVVFCGFMFYMVLFTVLLRLGRRYKINFTVLLLTLIVLVNIASHNNYHAARKLDATVDGTTSTRNDSLTNYFAHWLMNNQRLAEIKRHDAQHPYPVFLVNVYGGGIRAAAFTSFAIDNLDSVVEKMDGSYGDFEDYVFSYSGVSGGTIGASVMTAYRYRRLNNNIAPLKLDGFTQLYKNDYLTPVLSGMLGRDILGASVPILHKVMDDRAGIQEELWERNLANSNIIYDNDYFSYWNKDKISAYRMPLLFSNTANVDNGAKGIAAPLLLKNTDFATDVLINNQLLAGNETMRLSTVSFLSARFPYISPSAKLGDSAHFIDGGSRENSGAQTSADIYFALQRFKRDTAAIAKYPGLDTILKKVDFYFISMQNASPNGRTTPGKKVANPFELTSPIVTLINGGLEASALKSDSTLRFRYADRYAAIWPDVDCIPFDDRDTGSKRFSPVLPLGWQISDKALDRLKLSVTQPRAYSNNDTIMPGYYAILQWIRNRKE